MAFFKREGIRSKDPSRVSWFSLVQKTHMAGPTTLGVNTGDAGSVLEIRLAEETKLFGRGLRANCSRVLYKTDQLYARPGPSCWPRGGFTGIKNSLHHQPRVGQSSQG